VTNNNSILEVLYVVYIIITNDHQKFWGVVKTRNAGIWRNITEYAGISRNITEYHDIFPEYTGTSQYLPMVAMQLFINMDV
jgi:hypothetical protein